jgi:polyhydroxyalkanoate synthase
MLGRTLVDRAATELRRQTRRARNGVRYATGHKWVEVGATPKDVVWRSGKVELWHYQGARSGPAVLICPPLISRSYFLDLHPGNSFVEHIASAGFSTFLIDWGIPGARESGNSLETYVDRLLPRAIRATVEAAGTDAVTLLGYCLGGNLALMLAAAHPELPLRDMIVMATPVDWNALGGGLASVRTGVLDVDHLLNDEGNIPATTVRNYFRMAKPTNQVVNYVTLFENLDDDRFMVGYQAMSQWVEDHIPFPGAAARQIAQMWLRENAFMTRQLRLDGRPLDLSRITTPVLNVLAERDEIVPPEASAPIPSLLPAAETVEVRLPGGHIGLITGRAARTVTYPAVVSWLNGERPTAH